MRGPEILISLQDDSGIRLKSKKKTHTVTADINLKEWISNNFKYEKFNFVFLSDVST